MLSIGRITSEINRKIEPNEIEASVAVSSEVKILPINIPAKVKNDVIISKSKAVIGSADKICDLKNIKDSAIIITS